MMALWRRAQAWAVAADTMPNAVLRVTVITSPFVALIALGWWLLGRN